VPQIDNHYIQTTTDTTTGTSVYPPSPSTLTVEQLKQEVMKNQLMYDNGKNTTAINSHFMDEKVAQPPQKTYNGSMRRIKASKGNYYIDLRTSVARGSAKQVDVIGSLHRGGAWKRVFDKNHVQENGVVSESIYQTKGSWQTHSDYTLEELFGKIINQVEEAVHVHERVAEVQSIPVNSLRAIEEFSQLEGEPSDSQDIAMTAPNPMNMQRVISTTVAPVNTKKDTKEALELQKLFDKLLKDRLDKWGEM
jgi:hypothetical protein